MSVQNLDVFEEFALRVCGSGGKSRAPGVGMDGLEREAAHDKTYLAGIISHRFFQYRMCGPAGRTLKIAEHHYRDGRIRGTGGWRISQGNILYYRFRCG